jgi:hypothetical protein
VARKKATDTIDDPVVDEATTKEITKVKNIARANQTVFAVTGKPIVFDADGIAEPDKEDLDYMLTIPGYKGI